MEPDPAMDLENDIAMGPRFAEPFDSERLGPPSGYTCPDCKGSLMAVGTTNYRCRVGHVFSADSLLLTQRSDVESALWTAYRALEERAAICRRLAERARDRHADITVQHFLADAADVGRQAEALRTVLWSKQWAGAQSVEESPGTGEEQGAGGRDREG